MLIAEVIADGPGIDTTLTLWVAAAETSSVAGSLIPGMPASDTNATSCFVRDSSNIGSFLCLLCS